MFTESEKALYTLLIENRLDDYAYVCHQKRKISMQDAKLNDTKVDENNVTKCKAWNVKEINRFNLH